MDAFRSLGGDSPAAIDQKYPTNKGHFTWGELRCLARSLGFQDNLFKKYVPKEYQTAEGLPDHILLYLIDLKAFDAGIHRTVNMQSAEYNNKVLRKSVRMLRAREISLPDLREVRVAFSVYESHDMTGIKAEEHTLLQALKLCGRIASPMHLMSEVRRIKDVHLAGSLQFYEFLDLIKICHRTNDEKFTTHSSLENSRGSKQMYSMVDFEDLFTTEDERKLAVLDREFQLSIFRPQKDSPLLIRKPMKPTSVRGDVRKEMATAAQLTAGPLRSKVRSSNEKVTITRHSQTSRDCCSRTGRRDGAVITETDALQRSRQSEMEDSPAARDNGRQTSHSTVRTAIPVSLWHRDPVVPQKDRDEYRIRKEALEWDLILKERTPEEDVADVGLVIADYHKTNRPVRHAPVTSNKAPISSTT